MNFTLNGEPFTLTEGKTLSDLVATLELSGKRYAIEVNEEIIPRSEHDTYLLQNEDSVEVVQAIGGG